VPLRRTGPRLPVPACWSCPRGRGPRLLSAPLAGPGSPVAGGLCPCTGAVRRPAVSCCPGLVLRRPSRPSTSDSHESVLLSVARSWSAASCSADRHSPASTLVLLPNGERVPAGLPDALLPPEAEILGRGVLDVRCRPMSLNRHHRLKVHMPHRRHTHLIARPHLTPPSCCLGTHSEGVVTGCGGHWIVWTVSTAEGATWGTGMAAMCCGGRVLAGGWPVGVGASRGWPRGARVRGHAGGWGVVLGRAKVREVRHEIAWSVFIGELQIGVSLGVRRSDGLVQDGAGRWGMTLVCWGNGVLHVHVHGAPGFQTAFTFFGYSRLGLLRGN
jgi:hypothetical protein